MAPGFPVDGGSQVLGSVNSGVAPWRAGLVPNIFAGQQIFPNAVLFLLCAVGKSRCRSTGPRALRSKWLER